MHSYANNESISIVGEENICSPIRACVRCKNVLEWSFERGEGREEGGGRGSRSTIHYLQDSLVPPVKPGPPPAPEYLIDCKIKVAKFPEFLSLVLVTESLVWSSTGTLVVSGFMHHSVLHSQSQHQK